MKRSELLFCISLNLLLASLLIGAFQIRPAYAQTPYLKFVKEYYFAPLLDSNPHGRLNLIVTICKLMNDGSSSYDWYFYSNIASGKQGIRLQTVPGKVCYNSDWETAHTYASHTVWNAGTYRWLVDYDPTTTDGFTSATATASVTISPEGGGVGYSQSYTYNIPYIKVIDKSDFAAHRAYWEHDFNEQGDPIGAPSDSTYLARPAFVVKTTQNSWSFVDGWYKVMWAHPVWWWWESKTFESSTLYLDAQMSGDVETKITIQSWPTTDIYARSHGMAIDQDLPENWWQYSGYEFKVTASAFTYEKWVCLTYGSHYVEYAASGYVPDYAWHAKIYINDVLKAEGDVGRYNQHHLRANFAV